MKKIFYIQKYAIWQQNQNNDMPDISFIPALLRRRLTTVEKIGLYLANQLEPFPEDCHIVFASRFGEWQQTIDLIQQFYQEKEMSPAGFSHSVHNAMPGLLSILNKDHNTYTSIAAQNETIESGLTEAFCEKQPALFIYAEEQTPTFYHSKFANPFLSHGAAFIISNKASPGAQQISMETGNPSSDPVTFSQLCQFLNTADDLACRHFLLRKIK